MMDHEFFHVAALIALGFTSVDAHAQSGYFGKGFFDIAWRDDGNDNGLIEPGEKAIGKVTVTFDPPAGSIIIFPTGAKAEVKALHRATLGVLSIENGATGKLDWKRPAPWTKGSAPTEVIPGGILWIESFQLAPPLNPTPDLSNPAHVLNIIWDPAGNYQPRTVKYFVDGIG
jgi:hypothetical protein